MNTKDNQRVRLTKRLFRESLIRLLQSQLLYEITVSQLCADAEINRSTFYKYYSNVYDIYEEIESEILSHSQECMLGVTAIEKNTILRQLEQLMQYIKENADVYKILIDNSQDSELPERMMKPAFEFIKSKPELLNSYWQGKEKYCYSYLISGSLVMIREWISSGLMESPHEIAEMLYTMAKNCLNLQSR